MGYSRVMVTGAALSAVVSLFYSLYIIPRKFSKQSPALYTVFFGLAFFLSSVIWYGIVCVFQIGKSETFFNVWQLISALRGSSYAAGTVLFSSSIDKLGIGKSTQWKNLQGPVGSVLMLFFLGEASGYKIIFVILGVLAIFVSAMLFTVQEKNADKKAFNIGILYAVLGAVCYGVNAFIQKILVNEGFIFSQLVFSSLSIFVTAALVFIIKNKRAAKKESARFSKQTRLPVIAGTLFCAASILLVIANDLIAGSVSFSIVQLNSVWTLLIGIFFFREIDFGANRARIILGLIFAVGAVAVLMMAL